MWDTTEKRYYIIMTSFLHAFVVCIGFVVPGYVSNVFPNERALVCLVLGRHVMVLVIIRFFVIT